MTTSSDLVAWEIHHFAYFASSLPYGGPAETDGRSAFIRDLVSFLSNENLKTPKVVISVYAFLSAIVLNAMWAFADCLMGSISMCLMTWLERNKMFDTNKHFLSFDCPQRTENVAEYLCSSHLSARANMRIVWTGIFPLLLLLRARVHFWRLFMLFDFYTRIIHCVSPLHADGGPWWAMRFMVGAHGYVASCFPDLEFSAP